jgi:hypothetical protein
MMVLAKDSDNNGRSYTISINNYYLEYYDASGPYFDSTVQLTPNVWSHIAVVYDGSNINLYINHN